MKQKLLLASILTLALSAIGLSSFGDDNDAGMLGTSAEPSVASRTITITPNTNYVNVTSGETIKFVVGDKTFAWRFNGPSRHSEIDLNKIAPAGVLDHTVKVYIRRNPANNGG